MIYISKGKEPTSLTEYKKQKYVSYDGFSDKDAIRENLLQEQGCLCAYCMRRIDIKHMKIEHWYPEDRLTDVEKLDYQNMLGVCMGHIEGTRGADDTCDTHKGNDLITVNPMKPATLKTIQYSAETGEIYADDKMIQNDIDVILNLNSEAHMLQRNRRDFLKSLKMELRKMQQTGTWNRKMLEAMRDKYSQTDTTGRKREYAGVAIWYLDKRLKKA